MPEEEILRGATNKVMVRGHSWLIIAAALISSVLGMVSIAKADSYPASVQWAYYHGGWHEWYTSSAEAGQAAFAGWTPPAYIKNPGKLDWFLGGCSSKTFIDRGPGQFNYVHVLLSTTSSVNGLWCENTQISLTYYYYCPHGGELSYFNVGQCINAPPCPASQVRDVATGECKPKATCPVTPLNNPPFSDACSTSLEKGKGVDVDNKCRTLREPDMVAAAKCIADKINALSTPKINYSGPSATIRTAEYQNHLREIWEKSSQLNTIMNSVVFPAETKPACMQRRAEVDGEKQQHKIKYQPSSAEEAAPHVERRAIDVPEAVAKSLINQVTVYSTIISRVNGKLKTKRVVTSNVEDYMHSATVNPPACDSNIRWGGLFNRYDPVHFQLP
jgi:hypothetical protein